MRFNWHGLIGLLGIALMITVSALKSWDISLFFLTAAVVVYAIAIIALSHREDSLLPKRSRGNVVYSDLTALSTWLIGWHLASILFALALVFSSGTATLFVLCILVGHTFAQTQTVPALWLGNLGIVLLVIITLVNPADSTALFGGLCIFTFSLLVVGSALIGELGKVDRRFIFGFGLALWVWAAALILPPGSLSIAGLSGDEEVFIIHLLIYIGGLAIGLAVPFMLFRK